jgi:hypothetical protein
MFGSDLSGLIDDLAELAKNAPEVLEAIAALDKEIYGGIQSYKLKNGSHIDTTMLDKLSKADSQTVLASIVGRFYERETTRHQYKVVKDEDMDRIAIVSENMSKKYIHVYRPG